MLEGIHTLYYSCEVRKEMNIRMGNMKQVVRWNKLMRFSKSYYGNSKLTITS